MRTIEGVRLTSCAEWCLWEALRRYQNFGLRDGKTLEQAWTGLGAPSTYKDVVKAGVMVPACGPERARASNWYRLTPLGIRVMLAWLIINHKGGAS